MNTFDAISIRIGAIWGEVRKLGMTAPLGCAYASDSGGKRKRWRARMPLRFVIETQAEGRDAELTR
jgi:hypothetical protein